jgi:hypothetical protein
MSSSDGPAHSASIYPFVFDLRIVFLWALRRCFFLARRASSYLFNVPALVLPLVPVEDAGPEFSAVLIKFSQFCAEFLWCMSLFSALNVHCTQRSLT